MTMMEKTIIPTTNKKAGLINKIPNLTTNLQKQTKFSSPFMHAHIYASYFLKIY